MDDGVEVGGVEASYEGGSSGAGSLLSIVHIDLIVTESSFMPERPLKRTRSIAFS
jgi:hypothetical protein